jgi:septum formation protein
MNGRPPLVLASRSPRRADILTQMGVPFVVDSADIDETPLPNETPRELVMRLATAKCLAVAARHPADTVVLGADTTVDVDGEIFGTPTDIDHARSMLRRLSGRTHQVHTAVCVAHGGDHRADRDTNHRTALDTAAVSMHPIDADLLERYLATGESLDKAGAYAVQGEAAMFVERVTGHLTTVVGLPVRMVEQLLGSLSGR